MAYPTSKTPVLLLAFANDDGRTLRQLDEEQRDLKQILDSPQLAGKCEVKVLTSDRTTFDKNIRTVSEHIRNIYKGEELEEQATSRKFRIVQT